MRKKRRGAATKQTPHREPNRNQRLGDEYCIDSDWRHTRTEIVGQRQKVGEPYNAVTVQVALHTCCAFLAEVV